MPVCARRSPRAADAGEPAEPVREAVDDVDVEGPHRAERGAERLDDPPVVQLVDEVLVHQEPVERARRARDRGGIRPVAHVHREADEDPDHAGGDGDRGEA